MYIYIIILAHHASQAIVNHENITFSNPPSKLETYINALKERGDSAPGLNSLTASLRVLQDYGNDLSHVAGHRTQSGNGKVVEMPKVEHGYDTLLIIGRLVVNAGEEVTQLLKRPGPAAVHVIKLPQNDKPTSERPHFQEHCLNPLCTLSHCRLPGSCPTPATASGSGGSSSPGSQPQCSCEVGRLVHKVITAAPLLHRKAEGQQVIDLCGNLIEQLSELRYLGFEDDGSEPSQIVQALSGLLYPMMEWPWSIKLLLEPFGNSARQLNEAIVKVGGWVDGCARWYLWRIKFDYLIPPLLQMALDKAGLTPVGKKKPPPHALFTLLADADHVSLAAALQVLHEYGTKLSHDSSSPPVQPAGDAATGMEAVKMPLPECSHDTLLILGSVAVHAYKETREMGALG